MSDERIHVDLSGGVLTLTIRHPESRNGLTTAACRDLAEAIESHSDARVIVIRGDAGHFCSGADLKWAAGKLQGATKDERKAYVTDGFHRAIRALIGAPQPVLAVIEGACVGFGFDLAMACDLRLCASSSKFGQVFSRIALVPDGGSSYTLPRLVGLGRAMELMLLAETFDGEKARELGLVNRCVGADELQALADDWATRLAAGPPLAFRHGKANLYAGATGTLDAALEREAETQSECLGSADCMRGVSAFFMRETPSFQGD